MRFLCVCFLVLCQHKAKSGSVSFILKAAWFSWTFRTS
jgi:hypothetical protein